MERIITDFDPATSIIFQQKFRMLSLIELNNKQSNIIKLIGT